MATYPDNIANFTTKIDNVDSVLAAHPNSIQAEVVAVEQTLGTSPNVSVLGTGGLPAYNAAPSSSTFSTVKARIANIEAGLNTALTVPFGYITLSSGNISGTAGTPITYNVSSTGYRKLVMVIYIGSVNGCTNVLARINALNTNYSYAFNKYGTATWTSVTGGGSVPVSCSSAPIAQETIVLEISEPAITGDKAISFTGRNGFGTGSVLTSGMGSPVTTIDIQFNTGVPTSSTYVIYGVK